MFFDTIFLTKIAFLFIIGFFTIFTFVIVNQIKTMNQVVAEEKSSGLLFILAIINFIIAISLFVFTLVIL